ncbi:SAM-dependent methyltransferase [Sporosarcina sp. NCCP-2716]|uniref:SAM-dependent methyltransferase n=1 Tax=Sporosarcina sp. NCCP-2716 TaxID=2943679 RepID=UPI00204012E7|nr:class I SAM-dependent methyltransferase [Sporosarcina sp. NCCP-2716]GKV67509.1 SAM-dependent methyltransferase [Sporosarcina sp. NCCP-2716]
MTKHPINQQTRDFLNEHHLYENDPIQQIQLQHRLALVDAFNLPKGGRILEIGCGQGDTTMAIAHAIGAKGSVTAFDPASRDYGAPFTLGQATDHILQSSLGGRITFHLETDFQDYDVTEPYDVAVLSHSSWYFKSADELLNLLKKIRRAAKRICFAEWDIAFTDITQRTHFCAASLLALYSQFIINDSNVQNLFHKTEIGQFLEQAGFEMEHGTTVDASFLPDGEWERDYANSIRTELEEAVPGMGPLLTSYYELMNEPESGIQSLNSFVLSAI